MRNYRITTAFPGILACLHAWGGSLLFPSISEAFFASCLIKQNLQPSNGTTGLCTENRSTVALALDSELWHHTTSELQSADQVRPESGQICSTHWHPRMFLGSSLYLLRTPRVTRCRFVCDYQLGNMFSLAVKRGKYYTGVYYHPLIAAGA